MTDKVCRNQLSELYVPQPTTIESKIMSRVILFSVSERNEAVIEHNGKALQNQRKKKNKTKTY